MTEDLFREIGYVQKSNGELHLPSTSWRTTPYLKIDKRNDLQIRAYNGVKNEYRNVCFCAFYDANYKYISAYDTGVETNGYCEKTISVSEIPANAEYIRCSCIVTHRLECYVRPFDEYNILLDLHLKKSKNSDFK